MHGKNLSATQYLLLSLIPYSKPNVELAFRPGRFFYEMEKRYKIKPNTASNAFYRGIKSGLLTQFDDGRISLTEKGLKKVAPFTAKKITNGRLMVIFDVPEANKWKRQHLRCLLRALDFTQIQKSVWVSDYNHILVIKKEIGHLNLYDKIKIYECSEIL